MLMSYLWPEELIKYVYFQYSHAIWPQDFRRNVTLGMNINSIKINNQEVDYSSQMVI